MCSKRHHLVRHADNIARLPAIIADIDVAQTSEIVMVPLKKR